MTEARGAVPLREPAARRQLCAAAARGAGCAEAG